MPREGDEWRLAVTRRCLTASVSRLLADSGAMSTKAMRAAGAVAACVGRRLPESLASGSRLDAEQSTIPFARHTRKRKSSLMSAGIIVRSTTDVELTMLDLSTIEKWYTRGAGCLAGPRRGRRSVPAHRLAARHDAARAQSARDPTTCAAFKMRRPGLDHFSFGCRDRDELAQRVTRLDELGIAHGGIVDVGYRSGRRSGTPATLRWCCFPPYGESGVARRAADTV